MNENQFREKIQAVLNIALMLRKRLPATLRAKLKTKFDEYIQDIENYLP